MKMRIYGCLVAVCALALGACSDEIETAAGDGGKRLTLTVGDYPAFVGDAQTRTVGEFDAGKSAWETGDRVLVTISSQMENEEDDRVQRSTLTYDAETKTWTAVPQLYIDSDSYSVTGYYAPDYEWNGSDLQLKAGAVAGTSEFLVSRSSEIEFLAADRKYSRLRIAAGVTAGITVTMPNFTPVNSDKAQGEGTISLTTDAKGNAYLYGTWSANSTISVTTADGAALATKSNVAASVANTSYVLGAYGSSYSNFGDGSAKRPYQIYTAQQLQSMNTAEAVDEKIFAGKYIQLMRDIDCASIETFVPIDGTNNIAFAGVFDGNGYAIKNLKLGISPAVGLNSSGLFSFTDGATLKNLTLFDPRSDGNAQIAGALVATSFDTTVDNCHVRVSEGSTATINATQAAGGLIGVQHTSSATLTGDVVNSSAAIPVTGGELGLGFGGGLIGMVQGNNTIIGCKATGSVTGTNAGGLVGGIRKLLTSDSNVMILACYATGEVTSNNSGGGGLAGFDGMTLSILSSYTTSKVTGTGYLGAILGGRSAGTEVVTIYHTAAISNLNAIGNGEPESGSTYTAVTTAGELRSAITSAGAETEWAKADYTAAKTACGIADKSLAEVWVNVAGAAPKLWWEK